MLDVLQNDSSRRSWANCHFGVSEKTTSPTGYRFRVIGLGFMIRVSVTVKVRVRVRLLSVSVFKKTIGAECLKTAHHRIPHITAHHKFMGITVPHITLTGPHITLHRPT